jgi:hypothetical protein
MPADTDSSIAPAIRSGSPRAWCRRCRPTTVTVSPQPVDVTYWQRVQRDLSLRAGAVVPAHFVSSGLCTPILAGGRSGINAVL